MDKSESRCQYLPWIAADTHIKSLRAKLKAINDNDDPIQTHRGMGL